MTAGRRSIVLTAPLVATAIVVLSLLAEACSRRTPAPLDADGPPDRFSAGRALAVVEHLLGDQAPHPVGSEANARVRERIEAELDALGLTSTRQSAFVCRRGRVCAPVVNVVARVDGEIDAPAVLLVSHYDSVHAGPGAGDDIHGVAVMLEVARALVRETPRRHPLVLLFDEGEEVGLLGAAAFARERALVGEIGVVVNIEARGTTGRTSMFETAAGNAALVGRYADAVADPEATSLAIEVYRRMPNDTDFTVLREAGLVGLNLAFIGGVARYHTPRDDIEHLDAGSVQHQGDTVLALARTLADDIPTGSGEDAAFTDVLGIAMLTWPAGWSVPMLALALFGLVVLVVVARRRGHVSVCGLMLGFGGVIAIILVPTLVGVGVVRLVGATHEAGVAALAHPLPMRIGAWSAVSAGAVAISTALARRVRALESALAAWSTWAIAGVLACVVAPGAAPLFVLPVMPGTAALAVGVLRRRFELPAFSFALAAFAVPWASLAFGLEDAFGWSLAAAVVLPIAAIATTAAWAFTGEADAPIRRAVLVGCAVIAVVAAGAAAAVDRYDRHAPRRLGFVHWDDRDRGEATILLAAADGTLPHGLGSFVDPPRPVLPWTSAPMWASATASTLAPPPQLAVTRSEPTGGGRSMDGLLSSPRGADRALLLAHDRTRVASLRVGGEAVELVGEGPIALHVFGLPRAGVEVELQLAGVDPFELLVVDCSMGVPELELAAERDELGVPWQWGDATCVGLTHRL